MIKLNIDGQQVEVNEGLTVLEAAQEAGIYIPTLCYHPTLSAYGGCRLCVVEIEKMRGLPTACTTPATDGMLIQTSTPQLQEYRRGVLELILSEHPHPCLTCWRRERCRPYDICLRSVDITERCVTCSKNQQCELQRVVDYIGIGEITFPYTDKALPAYDDPLIKRDYNLCILCGRCVRVCQETRGIGAIAFTQRGSQALVGTAFDHPLAESGCRFCGACIEVCPTGALMDRAAVEQPWLEREAVIVPCHYACPAGIDVPLYVYLAGEGKYQDALAIIREKVPFPGVLGRVCIHPCEQACRRDKLNEPIAIKELKRFVADRDNGDWKRLARKLPPTNHKVAIVGSGPAGLTAGYYLAKLGHSVTVFEALSKAGGMMRVGIPDYRLPKAVLDAEINEIEQAGVEIRLNSRVESIDRLSEQGYEAVFLALGAHLGSKMRVAGEDSPGVVDGATFLRKVSLGEAVAAGNSVAVIGGGNVAIDSARTALRLGAKEVKILYRRTRAEMLKLDCIRMELGEPDASGRRSPVPIKGSEFSLYFDSIIAAIGQMPDIPDQFNLKTSRGNTLQVEEDTLETSRPGVWAGGDVTTGPASVIEAIAAGKKAAMAIDRYLGGEGVIDEELTGERQISLYVGPAEDFADRARVKMPCLAARQRVTSFREVELGLDEPAALAEGQRCFQCGIRRQIPPAPLPPAEARQQSWLTPPVAATA